MWLTLWLWAAAPGAGGEALFFHPGLGPNGVACGDCHGVSEREGDGLLRAGHSLYGVAGRTYWRGDSDRSQFPNLAEAIGPCHQIYQGGDALSADQAAALSAFLTEQGGKSRRDALKLQPALRADQNYAQPEYLAGQVGPGRDAFYRACHGCHPHGTKEGLGGVLAGLSVPDIARKVREGTGLLRGKRVPGAWMPFYGRDRLTDRQLAHIAAYIQTLPPPEATP